MLRILSHASLLDHYQNANQKRILTRISILPFVPDHSEAIHRVHASSQDSRGPRSMFLRRAVKNHRISCSAPTLMDLRAVHSGHAGGNPLACSFQDRNMTARILFRHRTPLCRWESVGLPRPT